MNRRPRPLVDLINAYAQLDQADRLLFEWFTAWRRDLDEPFPTPRERGNS